MFLISDNTDTYTGLRLVGVDGVIVKNENDFDENLKKVLSNKEIAVLIFTEKIADKFNVKIIEIKSTQNDILTVVIPDRHGSKNSNNFLSRYISEAIGIKIND
jgi:V/A-type H+-transporting ATPase subunit F